MFAPRQRVLVQWDTDEYHAARVLQVRDELDGRRVIQVLQVEYEEDGQVLWHSPLDRPPRPTTLLDEAEEPGSASEVSCADLGWQKLELRCASAETGLDPTRSFASLSSLLSPTFLPLS